MRRLRAAQKFVASFLKSHQAWSLEDYPVWTREQDVANISGSERLRPTRWFAMIDGWSLSAVGETEAEALNNLSAAFESEKNIRPRLPRPGTNVPIEFASEERISKIPNSVYEDFVERVLEQDWVIMTDESSLWDFHSDESNQAYLAKIKELYGVDVSDVPNANIAIILERLAAAARTT